MMNLINRMVSGRRPRLSRLALRGAAAFALLVAGSVAQAQDEVRYSWFEISYVNQDFDRQGSQTSFADPLEPQLVEIDGSDGSGIKFRGSVGTWNNLYAFLFGVRSPLDEA